MSQLLKTFAFVKENPHVVIRPLNQAHIKLMKISMLTEGHVAFYSLNKYEVKFHYKPQVDLPFIAMVPVS